MDLNEFVKDKAGCYSMEAGVAVWEVKNNEFLRNIAMPEVHIQLFIMRGSMRVVINNQKVVLRSDSLTDVLRNKMSVSDASEDISAVFIFSSEAFVTRLMQDKPPFPVEYIMQVMEQPVFLLTSSQSVIVRERLELVLSVFRNTRHHHQFELLKCSLWMLYLEMSNIFLCQNDEVEASSETDRKRWLFMRFVKLLPISIKKERSIGFYASALCVSCQYLERVVKLISGQTACQWIQRSLIGEVNHQLKKTDNSIKQLANEFGFPDQATFTKYYKRNTGMTPTEYRENDKV